MSDPLIDPSPTSVVDAPSAPSSAVATAATTAAEDAIAAAAAMASAVAAAEAASAASLADASAAVFASSAAEDAASSSPPPPAAKTRTRSTNLTHEQKRLICLYAKQHPTATQAQLGKWAKDQFSLACVPSQSSISHTLKRRHTFEHMKSEDWSSKRMRTVKYPELDTALANWFLYCQARQVRIQGDEIKAKAQTFFDLMQLQATNGSGETPQFSNGWLHSFQSRHGFSRSPNTHAVDHELITCREDLVEATKGFTAWDVYWMDETRISVLLELERLTAAAAATDGDGGGDGDAVDLASAKQMTVAFCCNTDGSELMDPFFICDGPLDVAAEATASAGSGAAMQSVEYGFTYAYNKKIWMTPTLFREWMLAFDWKMHEENRHVVLLLDSFSSHQVKKMTLKNVTVRFVAQSPFGDSSCLETAELAVCAAVKRRYRQLQLAHAVAQKGDSMTEVDTLQAIQWVLKSWREVPKALVAEAFAQVGITIDETVSLTTPNADPSPAQSEEKVEVELMASLKQLEASESLKVADLVSPVGERIIDEDFTDQDFVDCALDSSLSTTIEGRNAEPPRKIARVSRVKKTFSPAVGAGLNGFGGRATSSTASARSVGPVRTAVSAEDLAAAGIADDEWQAWADSQRSRIDEFHALETVIRLAAEMNCESTTLLDLARMQAELLQKRQPDTRSAALVGVSGDVANSMSVGGDGKQPAGVCRFNFGAGSTTI